MRLFLILLAIGLIVAVFVVSGDPFYVAGGSDSAELIIDLPQRIRLICTGLASLSLLIWALRPSLLSTLIALTTIAGFGLAHNTVRVSGKNFEVVQSFALIPVSRISVVEGPTGDLAQSIFRGFGPLALNEADLNEAMSGLTRER